MVARFKPVHRGHAAVLEALVARADEILIGLGSVNRYDLDNPFTAEESAEMIERVVGRGRVRLLEVPDLGDGPRWAELVVDLFGPLDLFVTANPYVRELLAVRYPVVHPARLLAPERRVPLEGRMVRRALARGEDWRALVPGPVADYIEEAGLAVRFRREFGLATLAREHPPRVE
jgi:nicotinamide-nucleotide adenylyltransferase